MMSKIKFTDLLGLSLILFLICPLIAQMISFTKFKGVNIPFSLRHEDSIIEKGKYDFEILVPEQSTGTPIFILAIKKGGKTYCFLTGERLEYSTNIGTKLRNDPNIPDKPRLKMRRNPQDKMLYIIFESGKETTYRSLEKVRFKIEYVE